MTLIPSADAASSKALSEATNVGFGVADAQQDSQLKAVEGPDVMLHNKSDRLIDVASFKVDDPKFGYYIL